MKPSAIVYDMDGVIVDSESIWDQVRSGLTKEKGGAWRDDSSEHMMGMSRQEWSAYMANDLNVPMTPDEISDEVVKRILAEYQKHLPLLPGAKESAQELSELWPLGIASSANQELIDAVVQIGGMKDFFKVAYSSEHIGKGKPAPDVFLQACELLGADPKNSIAIEDSPNGIKAGLAAGMKVIAIPHADYRPDDEILELADVVIDSLKELTPEFIEAI